MMPFRRRLNNALEGWVDGSSALSRQQQEPLEAEIVSNPLCGEACNNAKCVHSVSMHGGNTFHARKGEIARSLGDWRAQTKQALRQTEANATAAPLGHQGTLMWIIACLWHFKPSSYLQPSGRVQSYPVQWRR